MTPRETRPESRRCDRRPISRPCIGGWLWAPNVVLAVAGDYRSARDWSRSCRRFWRGCRAAAAPEASSRAGSADALPAADAEFRGAAAAGAGRRACRRFPAPPLHAADYYVGEVADELFSGMASRLFERVREEKGLAYFVRSARVSGLDAAMFCFFAGTQPGKEAEVVAEIDAEIARVQAGGVGGGPSSTAARPA